MGGRGETSDQKIRATQDQLRLARITQDVSSVDDDRVNVQKLIKKVVETTRCSVSQAEIALYDTDNNVEEAVNAILEEAYADDNVWKEQKSRRAKRAEAEERAEEQLASHRARNHPPRNPNNFSGSNRGRGSERGRGGYRGGARGGRGSYSGRGGYQHQSGGGGGTSNVWDNSQAKPDPAKEWTNATTNSVDDVPEDTDWKTAGTLVFSRRDDATPPAATPQAPLSAAAGATSSGAISFAAVAAAGASKPKEQPKSSTTSCSAVPPSTQQAQHAPSNAVNQSPLDGLNSLYQSKGVVSTSAQGGALSSSREAEGEHEKECASSPPSSMAAALMGGVAAPSNAAKAASAAPAATTSVQRPSPATAAGATAALPSGGTSASADWTAQLKNDLGIGGVKTAPLSHPPPKQVDSVQKAQQHKQTSVARPMVQMMQQHPHEHHSQHHQHQQQIPHTTVEFVSGGDANGPTPLPEYQFGFHVDTGVSAGQEHPQQTVAAQAQSQEDMFTAAASKQRSINRAAKMEAEMPNEASAPMMSNGAVCDFSSSISSQQQSKNVTSNGGVSLVPASHASAVPLAQTRQPATSGLSYADTSSMSYPSSETRNANALKPALSLHQQQQAQHQLYTAAQIPYNSYPYLNMYSPVTGVRQDEAQYAAALVQYPFGMGQIDMSSLSTMIPPAALASQQQASQPPPPVQPQHQQRPDQHGNFLDPKAYAAAAVANSTAGAGSGSALLGNQQQRDSTSVSGSAVAPPPGFSGPPSNLPTAAFTLPQHNHISSLFQMPPTYHPQLNQLPFSFMLPNVTNSAQHKLNHQMFAQQAVDDSLSDQRLSSQQQKVYGGHQQMDKYGSSGGAKDRLGGGAQATPPPQMYQAPQNYLSQQMPMHAHTKKTYNGPQHWSQS